MAAVAIPISEIESQVWPYQSATTAMIPYKANATNFYPETFLVDLYLRLREQNLVNTIYPGMGFDHLNKFVAYMGIHASLICFTREGEDISDVAGLGYITESDGRDGARKAGFGFGFFREYWGTQEARTLSWFMLAFWMFDLKIDVLFGTTLKVNSLARNFSQNFGFEIIGDIPSLFFRNDRLEDATIMLLRKEVFEPQYIKWRKSLMTQESRG